MEKEVIIKERVEKNLQVLKLLAKDDINISQKEKTEILKDIRGGADYVRQYILLRFIGN